MAHSLSTIPAHLRPATQKSQFIGWIAALPVNPGTKRHLIYTWRLANHIHFTAEEYIQCGLLLPK